MRFFASFLLAAAVAAGCGETAASSYPEDAGSDASTDPDGDIVFPDGGVDRGVDGGDSDGGLDGGLDGGVDGGLDGGVDGGSSWCNTSALCPSCPDPDALCDPENPCPSGEVCLLTGCEDLSRCFVTGGGACQDDEDCANPAYSCDQTINRCLRVVSGCDDSNDCVAGFACEDGSCADRRVPCASGADCPHGFTCFFASADQRFCRRITRPCDNDIDCLTLGVPCGDPNRDGDQECMPSLMPNAPDPVSCDLLQCAEVTAPVCESSIEGTVATCGQFGPCDQPENCATGFTCVDLWGDGRKECVLPGGFCADSRDCAFRQVCGSPRTGTAPTCVSGATM
ncbi:MAG: hypothetical protein HKP36_14615 [Myxococcales bacterium]|nr:hypothetical protein [Deltaproteobacteria bacterium]NNL25673.1 hypothetical protein [Myxococcales bacterium]